MSAKNNPILPSLQGAYGYMASAMRNNPEFSQGLYSKGRPVRRWSRATIGTTPGARIDFLQNVTQVGGNHGKAQSFGDVFFLITDIRVVLWSLLTAEVLQVNSAQLNNLLASAWLNFRVEERPVVKNEPLHLYSVGQGLTVQTTLANAGVAAAADVYVCEAGGPTGLSHHDWAHYAPDMTALCWLDIDTAVMGADSLAAILKAQVTFYGVEWSRPSAA